MVDSALDLFGTIMIGRAKFESTQCIKRKYRYINIASKFIERKLTKRCSAKSYSYLKEGPMCEDIG